MYCVYLLTNFYDYDYDYDYKKYIILIELMEIWIRSVNYLINTAMNEDKTMLTMRIENV